MFGPRGETQHYGCDSYFDPDIAEVCENPPPDPLGESFSVCGQDTIPFPIRRDRDLYQSPGERAAYTRAQRKEIAAQLMSANWPKPSDISVIHVKVPARWVVRLVAWFVRWWKS